jgi:hypothetical protein
MKFLVENCKVPGALGTFLEKTKENNLLTGEKGGGNAGGSLGALGALGANVEGGQAQRR